MRQKLTIKSIGQEEIKLILRRDFVKYCGSLGLAILGKNLTSITDVIPTQTPHLIMQLDWKYNVQFPY